MSYRFSKSQLEAISHKKGPCLVVAGPGSGKTTVICNRIKYLIEKAKVEPSKILVISFTRAAAYEMENRFKYLTGGCSYKVRFGTFHSIFFWIIKTAYNLNNSCIISEEDKRKLIDKLMTSMSVQYDNKEEIISSVISQIGIVKCDMLDIEHYYSKDMPEEVFRVLYNRLNKEMKRLGKLDFDDMMVMCYDLLVNRPDILAKCRNMFEYILVDEFQDSNRLQYEIFKMLLGPDKNGFVVGDDDQSVYGFRGARPEIMQNFLKDFPNCNKVLLGENYRSDRLIINCSKKVISNNTKRFDKKLCSMSKNNGIVEIIKTKDVQDENLKLIENIRKHHKEGIPYDKQAILYRTNIQPRRLVYKLNQFNIPYTVSDSMPNIFEHFVVRDIMDYMRLALGDNSRALFLRIMNKPSRYISRDYLQEETIDYDKLRWRMRDKDYVVDNLDKLMADIKLIKRMRPYPALNYIRKGVGYEDYIKKYAQEKLIDYTELIDILDELANMIIDMKSFGELFDFIDEYTGLMKAQQGKNKAQSGIKLMTMHSSKGLEFDCVYIIDAVEGITPHKKSKTDSELEEERRMFYVAMTRARKELYIYFPETVSGKPSTTSRFVYDVYEGLENREE